MPPDQQRLRLRLLLMDDPMQRLPLDQLLEAVSYLLQIFHHFGLLVVNILKVVAFILNSESVHHRIEHHILTAECLNVLMKRLRVQFENDHLQALHHLL